MRVLELALKSIPEAATNPFAFLAYAWRSAPGCGSRTGPLG